MGTRLRNESRSRDFWKERGPSRMGTGVQERFVQGRDKSEQST